MNKKLLLLFALILTISAVYLTGCGSDENSNTEMSVTAPTGTYIGHDNDGITEFLGIRYAAPVERWKAPTDVSTTADDEFIADTWGPCCIQPYDEVESASQGELSEDCLNLNIWTKDTNVSGKPVMIFIHGGGFMNGGSNDPLYYGDSTVRNLSEDEDMVFVSINYRTNIFGSIDLSQLEGYTDEYYDSINLWMLDIIQALKWVNENIESFGGNTDNITLCGQSCGGMAISYLLSMPETHEYFQKAIIQSGTPFICQTTKEKKQQTSKDVFDVLGVTSIEDITSISEKDLKNKYIGSIFEAAGVPTNIYVDGKIIPENWWDNIREGSAKDIKVLMGSVTGEGDGMAFDYDNMPNALEDKQVLWERIAATIAKKGGTATKYLINPVAEDGTPAFDLDAFLATGKNKVQTMMDLYNAIGYLQAAEYMGEALSEYTDVYLYIWEYAPSSDSVIEYCNEQGYEAEFSPFERPLHCMDLVFSLGNLDGYDTLTGDPDKIPTTLVKNTQAAWYSFIKNGNPNTDAIPSWEKYDSTYRNIMLINEEWNLVKDPRKAQRETLTLRPQGEK